MSSLNIIQDAAGPLRKSVYDALQRNHLKLICVREWVDIRVLPYVTEDYKSHRVGIGVTVTARLPDGTEISDTHNGSIDKSAIITEHAAGIVREMVIRHTQLCIADLIPKLVLCADMFKENWIDTYNSITSRLGAPTDNVYVDVTHGRIFLRDTWWYIQGPGRRL